MAAIPQNPEDGEMTVLQGVIPTLPVPSAPNRLTNPSRPKGFQLVVSADPTLGEDMKMRLTAVHRAPNVGELVGHDG